MLGIRRWLLAACLLALLLAVGYAMLLWNRLPEGVTGNRIVVSKSNHSLVLYSGTKALKTYRISLGREPVGAKQFEGDGRTPEGIYEIAGRNAKSTCHLALRISYPSASDLTRARTMGRPPGGDIMIHGMRNGFGWLGRWHRWRDWTAGCIAVTNAEMDELWRVVPDGTSVEIRP